MNALLEPINVTLTQHHVWITLGMFLVTLAHVSMDFSK